MNKIESTRIGFMQGLDTLAEKDDRIMLVCADSLLAMRATDFVAKYPEQYVEIGIAEQNAAATSAGLALEGLIPFFATYAGFITMRACEQIRTFIAYPNLNVKLAGVNGGIAGGEREGTTHQFFEDIGILRTIPNMTIIVPADADQARQAAIAAAKIPGPVYLRLGSGRDPVVFEKNTPFVPGKINVLQNKGNDIALFGNGVLLPRLIEAAQILQTKGIGVTLVEVHTVKPIDVEGVIGVLKQCGAALTAEDHNIIGGLGSAIMETAAEHCPVPITRIGLRDKFPGSGLPHELLDYYEMAVNDIVNAAENTVKRK
ncbi:transketolase C-terminal domain-containing protein [uncultured Draconibacterium sp.]|uniref:transketolase family protein n=1 Tax=uncultured Draconibacterium sp. TaxID=1573823 RepID=UPI0025DC4C22|nr:transketolase C-terminal domain-containing protein [uncultured Draconibacterium sp.]